MRRLWDQRQQRALLEVLLLTFICNFASLCGAQWRPKDFYLIDCGSSAPNSTNSDTQTVWRGEPPNATNNAGSSGVAMSTALQNSGLPSSVPYLTARAFTAPSNYSFSVAAGRHWLRLHFYPFADGSSDLTHANFTVRTTAGFELFSGLVPTTGDQPYLVREYNLPIRGSIFTLIFDPAPGSVAFVNGIELISMPDGAIQDDAVLLGQGAVEKFGLENLALETMYRLNVGGASVNPMNDTQKRRWIADEKFIEGAAQGSPTTDGAAYIRYPKGVPEFIAPALVYGTARVLGSSNTVNNNFNVSWRLPVDPGFVYFVRLHFAELIFDKTYQRIFNVYLNNRTALNAFDLIATTEARYVPVYRDFAVVVPSHLTSIRVQIGATPDSGAQYSEAILNGLEVLKMNNSAGGLANAIEVVEGSDSRISKSSSRSSGAILGVTLGTLAAFAVLAILCYLCCRKGRSAKGTAPWRQIPSHAGTSITSLGSPQSRTGSLASSCRHFPLQQIMEATNNFDEELLLGIGGFGKVYKGEVDGGLKVAVKRGNPRSEQGLNEFLTEIEMLSRLRHRHLVSLIGYCDENSEMILVYDYMGNGPLRGHLYGTDLPPLPWKLRLEICIGAAKGLHYLHTGAARAIIHRDVKTTNILLDDNFVAKVADFGLSKVGPSLEHTHVSTVVKGSFGYLDPEYFRRQQLTEKSDVYSFGVVLLEVLCARPAINPALSREQVNIAEWAMQLQKRGMLESIMDPALAGDCTLQSLQKFAETADSCLADRGSERPSMGRVLGNLECALQLHEAAGRQSRQATAAVQLEQDAGVQQRNAAVSDHALELMPLSGAVHVSHEQIDSGGHSSIVNGSSSAVFSQLVNPEGR